jgi:hypothetical protein
MPHLWGRVPTALDLSQTMSARRPAIINGVEGVRDCVIGVYSVCLARFGR